MATIVFAELRLQHVTEVATGFGPDVLCSVTVESTGGETIAINGNADCK